MTQQPPSQTSLFHLRHAPLLRVFMPSIESDWLPNPRGHMHSVNNLILHINISPWGEGIAANLLLLRDQIRTETCISFGLLSADEALAHTTRCLFSTNTHPWYGTIVVEMEGTNEALAVLQEWCGPGVFPSCPGCNAHRPLLGLRI
ncbi:uncharacterized protein LACBIDRAFT_313353 [Laccaria bicolor S238N-H82]|uniref:Predicted protein n=1 Tax=Laccaria bicolor (strain S238N-H82 / ATCC MYA-4686) TaxID=486041 RepID=B0DY48_LACBS|nr:uncharacterized protein LACBIDRAFT_313353 [Laccaria bicolor S238N-H82]EDR00457.1 predicted protein [Laccaria bicolor S238N-H82]|eukprot:XP_001888849.1 predicted protein [Laccaria bicolor S238N-H82]